PGLGPESPAGPDDAEAPHESHKPDDQYEPDEPHDPDGHEQLRLGAGELNRPSGLAFAGTTLYVADTGNHALRAIDLDTGTTRMVAGPPLRSPWGLAWDGRRLFVANAGTHEIWGYDPPTGQATPF